MGIIKRDGYNKMEYSFTCFGHENITAMHKTTLEFTKDERLSLNGDCIVGVKADFSLLQLKNFIKKLESNKVTIIIETLKNPRNFSSTINEDYNNKNRIEKNNNFKKSIAENKIKGNITNKKIIEKIDVEINPEFSSDNEMVIRKTNFVSERTLAIKAGRAAFELNKDLIDFLKAKENRIKVRILDRQ